jgi:hypothetical protein
LKVVSLPVMTTKILNPDLPRNIFFVIPVTSSNQDNLEQILLLKVLCAGLNNPSLEWNVCKSTFYNIWSEHFKHVKIPRNNRFSECKVCSELKPAKGERDPSRGHDLTDLQKEDIRVQQSARIKESERVFREHMAFVRQERDACYAEMHKSASSGGEEVFFFEVDGMDQSKTKLPHFQYKMPKDVDPDHLLHVHLTCVRYDGTRADDIYYYTNTLPHDSANTATIIWKTVLKVRNCIWACIAS